jgi:hypothetical protein
MGATDFKSSTNTSNGFNIHGNLVTFVMEPFVSEIRDLMGVEEISIPDQAQVYRLFASSHYIHYRLKQAFNTPLQTMA